MGDKRKAEEGKDEGEDERGENGQKVDCLNVEKHLNIKRISLWHICRGARAHGSEVREGQNETE